MSQLLEEYLEKKLIKPKGIVHLGAEWAQEAEMYERAGATYVVWAEASPENWEHPETRKCLSGRTDWQKMVRKAIWHESGLRLPFFIYNARSSNSLFTNDKMQTWYERHTPIAVVQVETITLDDLLEQNWPDRPLPDLLAMDLQGAELHALQGGRKYLSNPILKSIVTEAMTEPLYKGGCLLHELDEFLKEFGFVKMDQQRHTVGIHYVDTVGVAITEGRLAPIPQWDVLYQRS